MTNNWTIMVYISADDVPANFAIDSLNQLRQAATDDGDKVIALFDPNDGNKQTSYTVLTARTKRRHSARLRSPRASATWRIQRP
jgi:hypothetical protein